MRSNPAPSNRGVRRSHSEDRSRDERGMIARIASLYMVQGIPLGLGFEAIPTLQRALDAPLSTLAWAPLVGIPWMLNLLWAPVVDNRWSPRLGKRRSWILPLQSAMALGIAVLALVPFTPANLPLILALATLVSLVSATQDIAVDGLAAESLSTAALRAGNAAQVGGMAFGLLLGGAGVLIVADRASVQSALLLLAVVVLLSLLPLLFWREALPAHSIPRPRAQVRRFFNRPGAASILGLGLVATISGTVLHGLWRLVLVDFGWETSRIGLFSALGYTGVTALTSIVAGVIIHRLGERPAGALGIVAVGAAGCGWLSVVQGIWAPAPVLIATLIASSAFGIGLASVVVFAIVMRYAQRGVQPGTDFTVFQSSHVLGGMIASTLAIGLSASAGYGAGLMLGIVLCALALATLLRTDAAALDATPAASAIGDTTP